MGKQKTPKQLMEPLSKRVSKFRYDERLIIDKMAEKAGVSSVLLAQVEKNELENTSLKKMVDIANAVGCYLEVNLVEMYPES